MGLSMGENDGECVGSSVIAGLCVGENDGEKVGSPMFDVGMSPELFVSGMKTGLSVGERVLFFIYKKRTRVECECYVNRSRVTGK